MSHPLRDRDFRLLFLGRLVDELGDAATPAALTLAVVRSTGSAPALAIVLACTMIPRLVLLPLGGVIIDRLRPKRVAMIADLVRCAVQLFIGIELIAGDAHLAQLAIAGAVGGAASAFGIPAVSPLVAGTVDQAGRQQANSLMGMAASVTRLAGPLLAALVIFTIGPGWAFLLDAATFAFSAMTLLLIRVRPVEVPVQSLRADLVQGWSEVRSRTWYWVCLIAHATWNFAAGVFATLGPIIAVRELGGERVWLATLQASAVGYLIGSLLAGRVRVRRPILIANICMASYAFPLLLFATSAPAWLAVSSYGVALGCLGFLNPVWETVVQQHIPEHLLARVSAYDWLVSLGAMPLGYALGPLLADATSPAVPLVGSAVLVAVTMFGTLAVGEVRNLRMVDHATSSGPTPQDVARSPKELSGTVAG